MSLFDRLLGRLKLPQGDKGPLDRVALIESRIEGRLTTAFREIASGQAVPVVDMELHTSPPDEGLFTLIYSPHSDREQEFWVRPNDWRLPKEKTTADPYEGLGEDVLQVFANVWKKTSKSLPGARAYARWHDSATSIDLETGERLWDEDRPDYVEPERLPYAKTEPSSPADNRNGELVRRGDPESKVEAIYSTTENSIEPSPYSWPDRGIRITVLDGVVICTEYFAPFGETICGIWIGAHAWEVDAILGHAKGEFFLGSGRAWRYDFDGHMSVAFDETDRVSQICR